MRRASPIFAASLLAASLLAAACSGDDAHHGGVTATETALVRYSTCSTLEADLKAMLVEDIEAHFDQERRFPFFGWGVEDSGGPPVPSASPSRQEGKDYSGTNNQESGVDEADFVKTDGYHIYVLNGNRLHIFGVPVFGALIPESVFEVEGWPREMLLDKQTGRVAIFSSISPYDLPTEHPLRARVASKDLDGQWLYRVSSITKLTVIEAHDRLAPRLSRELYLEADYQTARLVDRSVRVGAYSWLSIPSVERWYWWRYGSDDQPSQDQRESAAKAAVAKLALEDIVPQIYERLPDRTFNTHTLVADGCRSFSRPSDSHGRGVTSIMTIDLSSSLLALDADQILTNYAQIYASQDYLYVAEPAQDWWWYWWNDDQEDITNVHAFDISRPGETSYVGSGRVVGTINSPFAMDEHDGVLRAVTTTDRNVRWWIDADKRPQSENHVVTLAARDGRLKKVGGLDGLARGERVWAARFAGDRAFIVTFRNIDPLFVVDVADPAAPRLLGELKVEGVSTYLQEIAAGRLLSIGYGGDAQGLSWSPQISLFDTSDENHPGLLDTLALAGGAGGGWSEALYEHKAFQYWAPRKLLAVPVSSYANDGAYWYTSRLELVSVGDDGLTRYGTIDHSPYYNRGDRSRAWSLPDVRRSIFMGDFIYAISDAGISVHRLGDLSLVTDAALPGTWPGDHYWWW